MEHINKITETDGDKKYLIKGDQTYLSLSINLLVSTSLKPATFWTAMLLRQPTSPVPNPTRRASVHLSTRYWNLWTLSSDLQSCCKSSFSTILEKTQNNEQERMLSIWFWEVEWWLLFYFFTYTNTYIISFCGNPAFSLLSFPTVFSEIKQRV